MIIDYREYASHDDIPIRKTLKDRKMAKYFNLETAATIVGIHNILADSSYPDDMPLLFALCKVDYQNVHNIRIAESVKSFQQFFQLESDDPVFNQDTLEKIRSSAGQQYLNNGKFSPEKFNNNFMANISPINQFKVLGNLPVSFASIVFGLHGENITLYESSRSLILHGITIQYSGLFIIGSAKVSINASIKAGFALTSKDELKKSIYLAKDVCAIDMFHDWSINGFH